MGRCFLLLILILTVASCHREQSVILYGRIDGYNNRIINVYEAPSVYVNRPYGKLISFVRTND